MLRISEILGLFNAKVLAITTRLVENDQARSLASTSEDLHEIHLALAAMPLLVREAYLLRRVDKLSHAEIALRLGISRYEVQRLLRLAVKVLDRHASRRPSDP